MTAQILTIGDEILIGQVTDTNSAHIAGKLNSAGIEVTAMHSVGDRRDAILKALREAGEADVVIITGGLGPTNDDITKQTMAEFTGATSWQFHEPSLENIRRLFARRGLPMNEQSCNQALLPDTCEVILNRLGTAPGMLFNYGNTIYVALPGVPFETYAMIDDVIRKLSETRSLPPIFHRTLATFGLPESTLAERISEWENALPPHVRLAYLPDPLTGVRLRLSVYNPDASTEAEVERLVKQLRSIIGNAIYGEGGDTLEIVAQRLLQARKATVATAESCTGGKIASMLTSVAGVSACFKGGVVAYDNAVKINQLGVSAIDIEEHGAVSLPVAEQMAEGVRRLLQTDYAVATTGIAGPDGGTPQKPVGTVAIAVASPDGITSVMCLFTTDRQQNINRASAVALNMLIEKILS